MKNTAEKLCLLTKSEWVDTQKILYVVNCKNHENIFSLLIQIQSSNFYSNIN